MRHSRPSAWALICVLVVGLLGSAGTAVTLAADRQCTGWTDEFHPPTEIRVLRKRGPNAGRVEVVPFWNYVGTVLAAEYSTSGPRGPVWFRMGALAVKQYGWYYAMHWRGGTVTITNEDGSTTTECFDVRDSTADQIYKPERLVDGQWVPANVPSAANLSAMAETWSMSLRKWVVDKKKSRFFLTGYRSGKKNYCGADADAFRIKQKSLADCIVKGLVYEEAQREYYEPRLLVVDPRERDILDDDDTYYGDLGVLTPDGGSTDWRVYAGLDDGWANPVSGTFSIDPTKIGGHGTGDVTGDRRNDLVLLVTGATNKVRVARATGAGYEAPSSQELPDSAPTAQMLVADFDGDLLADVGLLRSTPVAPTAEEPATLVVMPGAANGTFGAAQDWWRAALDLATQQVAAGDVNGDGKADLVIRDGSAGVTISVAPSFASCADLTIWGPCPAVNPKGLDVPAVWLSKPGWAAADVKWTLTDFDRDSRTDVVAVVKDGAGIDVFGANALVNGGFSDTSLMWQSTNIPFSEVSVLGIDVNPDGLGDLLLMRKSGAVTAVQWLKAVQTAGVVTFSPTAAYTDNGLTWAPATTRAY